MDPVVYVLVFAMQLHSGEYVTRQVVDPFPDKPACEADMHKRIDKDRQTVRNVTGACIPVGDKAEPDRRSVKTA